MTLVCAVCRAGGDGCLTEPQTHNYIKPELHAFTGNDKTLHNFLKYFCPDSSFNSEQDLLPFSFCNVCAGILDKLERLDDQLELIKTEISSIIAQVSLSVIESEKNYCRHRNELSAQIKSPELRVERGNKMSGEKESPVICFRRGICQRFTPRVVLADCKKNASDGRGKENNFSISEDDGSGNDFEMSDQFNGDSEPPTPCDNNCTEKIKKHSSPEKKEKRENNESNKKSKKEIPNPEATPSSKMRGAVEISENVFSVGGKWKFEKGESGFVCLSCKSRSYSKALMLRHVNLKHNTDWNSCLVCKKSWRNPQKYEEHKANCRPKTPKKAPVLNLGEGKFVYDGRLPFQRLPPATPNGPARYECGTCNSIKNSRASLTIHFRLHHPANARPAVKPRRRRVKSANKHEVAKCTPTPTPEEEDEKNEDKNTPPRKIERAVRISEGLFSLAGTWNFEMMETGGFSCSTCGYKGQDKKRIVRHINERHNTQWFNCEACKKSWRTCVKYEEHKANCRPKVYKNAPVTKLGNGKFLYNGRLLFEKIAKEGEGGFLFKCVPCDSVKTSRAALTQHFRHRHSGIDEWCCDACGKVFKNARCLYTHKQTHITTKTHLCVTCGKLFKTGLLLNLHRKFHQDPSVRHPCEVCGQSFRYKHSLRKHRKRVGHLKQPPLDPQLNPDSLPLSLSEPAEIPDFSLQTSSFPQSSM